MNNNERIRELVSNRYPSTDDEVCEEYFEWLTYVVNLGKEHSMLARTLHNQEFVSLVKNDENRIEDGKVLRRIFEDETLFDDYRCLDKKGCSVLEMLVGLAIRMETILEDPAEGDRTIVWFWEMLDNLKLSEYTDYAIKYSNTVDIKEEIARKIANFVNRKYSRSGDGGVFPLKNAKKDQRKVELWYQLSAYLLENYIDEDEVCG